MIQDQTKLSDYLKEKGIIKTQIHCQSCTNIMRIQIYSSSIDGYVFRCASCKTRKSIRNGSFFESLKL